MKYRRMPIEIESPEQLGYGNIKYNLTESSVSDMTSSALGAELGNLLLCYTDHVGKPELRELIAGEGKGLAAGDVIVTPGAAAALFIIATSLLSPGDRIVVARPNYATNIETPRAIGCDTVFLDLEFENGFRVDIERLKELVAPGTKLVSLTCPHNPTGAMMTRGELEEVVSLVESRGCLLLFDETYREMAYNRALPPAASISPNVVSVASLSKSYGLPGIRMGWAITKDKDLQELFLAAKEQIFICNSVIDEEFAFRALSDKASILPRIFENNLKAFNVVKNWMAGQDVLEWVEPSGGVVCFPRIKENAGINIDQFYKTLNGKYSTHVGPGHWFEMPKSYMRIGYGWPSHADLASGLECISKALSDSTGK